MSRCTEIPGSPRATHPSSQSIPRKEHFFVSLKFDTILIGKMQHDEKNKKVLSFFVLIKG